jgi:hypothetical protein
VADAVQVTVEGATEPFVAVYEQETDSGALGVVAEQVKVPYEGVLFVSPFKATTHHL